MKKVLLTFAIATSIATAALASPMNSPAIVHNFMQQFKSAKQVVWATNTQGKTTASFLLNDTPVQVVYENDGTLLEKTRLLFPKDLPATILTALQQKFETPTVLSIQEKTTNKEVNYLVYFETNGKKYSINAQEDGSLGKKKRVY